MNANAMWGGALLVGVLAALGRQVQALLRRLAGLLVERVQIDGDDDLASAVYRHLFSGSVAARAGDRKYAGRVLHVRSLGRRRLVAFEALSRHGALFRVGRWPVFAAYTRAAGPMAPGSDVGQAGATSRDDGLRLVALRGTVDFDRLVAAAARDFTDDGLEVRRFHIFPCAGTATRRRAAALGGHRAADMQETGPQPHASAAWQAGGSGRHPGGRMLDHDPADVGDPLPRRGAALDAVALPPEGDDAVADVRRWLAARDWYEERSIPWRYGILLHGAPGNGKSTAVRALAQDLDLPIFAFDLGSMDNEEFAEHWTRCRDFAPCLALFEDFDRVFEGRRNVALAEGGVTFPAFLNALSGVATPAGVLTVITTNRPDVLDPAICAVAGDGRASRPGRIDRAVALGPPSPRCRQRIAARICTGQDASVIDRLVVDGAGDTGAQFEDRCRRAALAAYWGRDADDADAAATLCEDAA